MLFFRELSAGSQVWTAERVGVDKAEPGAWPVLLHDDP